MSFAPNKNFRITKQVKRTMATFSDPLARAVYKNAMIQAQMYSENVPAPRVRTDRSPAGE